ncbi:MAG TPA: amidohydrolase family protein [Thermoanaerobaculia bacterium]|nr:amidohydrolase family protein [Thermoanaerobaculia bacterium]
MKYALEKAGRGFVIATPLAALAIAILLSGGARALPTEVGTGDRLAYAITGARVIALPGRVFDPGVVVIRGGVIEAIGPAGSTSIPPDARVFERKGKVVHAAFVDPYVSADRLAGRRPRAPVDDEDAEGAFPAGRGGAGAAASGAPPPDPAHPEHRVVETLRVVERVAESYRRAGFAVVGAAPSSGILRGRGAVVTLGEGPLEGRILSADDAHYATLDPERLDFGSFSRAVYPASKMGAVALVRQTFADALWWRDAQAAYSRRPAGQRRPSWEAARAALVGAAEGREPVVFETGDVLSLLRAEKLARELKLRARFVTAGDEYRMRAVVLASKPDLIVRVDFPRPVRLDDDAEWMEVPLERLRRFDRSPSNPKWLRDAGASFSLTTAGLEEVDDFSRRVREAIARGLSKDDALAAVTVVPARQLGFADRLGTLEAGRFANLVVETGEPFAESTRATEIWIDGRRIEIPERRAAAGRSPGGEPRYEADSRPLPGPEAGPLASPKAVVIRHATVWTQGPAGVIDDGDLVAVGGKITAVGRALAAPSGAVEIDGHGMHLTPGIVDCHSHTAVDGQVNEGTHAVSAEVRIQDVIDPLDVAVYRELAGGTTTANVLHGSANAIGGQNAILKWRWGSAPDEYLLAGAPPGIKFALGENPKQSNFQNPRPRYPATRMGVANLIRERFLAARDYRRRQEEYRKAAAVKGAAPVPPSPDLQLEAIAEILEGKRQIHCHSYRKDEILEVLRVAEEFGVKVATLQHVLEGYKVADEMARHGAGGSTFSDWWAYKPEAYDAIPYNGALMRERGVVVSFNSDSDELARRLNWEAAKAVRYGGVPPADALAFVTSNPAKQLGIFQRVGSLEPGKDADFVLWSGDPLSTTSIAMQTWVDGRKYFDRAADLAGRPALEKEKADLIARAKKTVDLERRRARPSEAEGAAAPAGPDRPIAPAPSRPPEEPERRPSPPPNVTPARPTPGPTPGAR